MERITSAEQLKPGTQFFYIQNDECEGYEVVCLHPHNPAYILAINSTTQDAPKLYIPKILSGNYYLGPYDSVFVRQQHLEYYKREVEREQRLINDAEERRHKEQEQQSKHA